MSSHSKDIIERRKREKNDNSDTGLFNGDNKYFKGKSLQGGKLKFCNFEEKLNKGKVFQGFWKL